MLVLERDNNNGSEKDTSDRKIKVLSGSQIPDDPAKRAEVRAKWIKAGYDGVRYEKASKDKPIKESKLQEGGTFIENEKLFITSVLGKRLSSKEKYFYAWLEIGKKIAKSTNVVIKTNHSVITTSSKSNIEDISSSGNIEMKDGTYVHVWGVEDYEVIIDESALVIVIDDWNTKFAFTCATQLEVYDDEKASLNNIKKLLSK